MDNLKTPGAAHRSRNSQHGQRSDAGQNPDQYIAAKRREAVEKVMAVFQERLAKQLDTISYALESSCASGAAHDGHGLSSGGGSSRRPPARKRQLNDDGDDQSDSASGGPGKDQDKGGNKRARTDGDKGPHFACPYFKHDPTRYGCQRSCSGPGWSSIHRLK